MSKHGIIIGAILITAAYIGGVLWLHYGWAADATLGAYIDGKKLNSVGDFLAGVFSPLAFLWLIATVLIQSKELSLQRQEITENREVMKDQADAAVSQATFLQEQTIAMKEQTALLIRQTEISDQSAARNHQIAMFEKRIDTYNDMVSVGKLARNRQFEKIESPMQDAINKALFLFDMSVINWMDSIIKANRERSEIRGELSDYFTRYAFDGSATTTSSDERAKLARIEKLENEIIRQFNGPILFEVFRESLILHSDQELQETT